MHAAERERTAVFAITTELYRQMNAAYVPDAWQTINQALAAHGFDNGAPISEEQIQAVKGTIARNADLFDLRSAQADAIAETTERALRQGYLVG
jgi:ABC-type sugar transport system substrate-binding protein